MSAVRMSLRGTTGVFAAALCLALIGVGLVAAPSLATVERVRLHVLLVGSGDAGTEAIRTELDRQGVPHTVVDPQSGDRPQITADFLADSTTGTAQFQAVVLPNQAGGGLSSAEMAALHAYESDYGIRQVNAFDWARPELGLNYSSYVGALDGAGLTVSQSGLEGAFGYLRGSLRIDDFDPSVSESYGYLATAFDPAPAGTAYTPMLTATIGDATGHVVGVLAKDGREEMVITAAFNQHQQWFNVIAEGIVSWATRGTYLGYNRNYFNVHIDDVLMPDARWSAEADCTPGDGCVDPTVTTTDIRMTPADVDRLVSWQASSGIRLDMVFNAAGSIDAIETSGGADPLTDALLANKSQFRWINHTYSHQYLGCIQIAPTVQGEPWRCATSPDDGPRIDPDVEHQIGPDGVLYDSQASIAAQVRDNLAWASANDLPGFVATELVTGEHSGLRTLPQMPDDNPFLAPALQENGVTVVASDASRERDTRELAGGLTQTVPRYPMNIFFNAGTYLDQVDEYNWIYTAAADGGSDLCNRFPETTTCIEPLPAATNAQAKASFDSYIRPLETRTALGFVLKNDPRPFYAHQSNLAEDGILYPVLDDIIAAYRGLFDTASTPLVQSGMTEQRDALVRLRDWRAANDTVDVYLDSNGVHVPDAGTAIPLTVPAGSVGGSLESYAQARSGWLGAAATVSLPGGSGGYLVDPVPAVPGSPEQVAATAGSQMASVAWLPPVSAGSSPVTGYRVRAFAGSASAPEVTITTGPSATSAVVTGLANGTTYRIDVAAVNALGTGPAVMSNPVTPDAANAPAPQAVRAQAGNLAGYVTWLAPGDMSGVTGYRVRAIRAADSKVERTVTVPATATSASVVDLKNDTGYSFDVTAIAGKVFRTPSELSTVITPSLTGQIPSAPSVASLVAGSKEVLVTWLPPIDASAGAPKEYRVEAYEGPTRTKAVTSAKATGSATQVLVTGLKNDKTYTFEVTVVYPSGVGPSSARSALSAPSPTVPAATPIGTATSGAEGGEITAKANWSEAKPNGGSAVTAYVVSAWRTDGTLVQSQVVGPGARSYTMTFAEPGEYYFTVVARNAIGDGDPSAPSNTVLGR